MASPLRALTALLILLAIAHHLPVTQAFGNLRNPTDEQHHFGIHKRHKGPFKPGPWKQAHATFYGNSDGSGTVEGACGYTSQMHEGYGIMTAAPSQAMFNNGEVCGACFELQCHDDPQWCKRGNPSVIVTATNLCPASETQSADNGGWCNPPREHFDLSQPAFLRLAEYKAGIIPVQYRRVPCWKKGGIRFTVTGNPYFMMVMVWNVGGAGDVTSMKVKGDDKVKWTVMKRNWGQNWQVEEPRLAGESMTFRVGTSDGRFATAWHVTPKNWQFGQTYVGKNFM